MYITAVVLSALLGLVMLAGGLPKLGLKGPAVELLRGKGFGDGMIRFIGLAEAAAFVGLIIGIWWQPLGIAAAIGAAAVMIGAVGYHAKWGDYANPETRGASMAPIVLALISIAAAVTLGLSL